MVDFSGETGYTTSKVLIINTNRRNTMAVDRNSKEFQEQVAKYKKIKIIVELAIIGVIAVIVLLQM